MISESNNTAPHSDVDPFVATAILTKALLDSPSGRIDYMTFLNAVFPGAGWIGHAHSRICSDLLNKVFDYCAKNRLPFLTTLVINKSLQGHGPRYARTLIEAAHRNGIYTGAKGDEAFSEHVETEAAEWVSYMKNATNRTAETLVCPF